MNLIASNKINVRITKNKKYRNMIQTIKLNVRKSTRNLRLSTDKLFSKKS